MAHVVPAGYVTLVIVPNDARVKATQQDDVPMTIIRESDGSHRSCVFKGCRGTMTHTDSAQLPGTGAIARMSDGELKIVGTTRRGWVCDLNPNHMQTEGISGSEVVRSQM